MVQNLIRVPNNIHAGFVTRATGSLPKAIVFAVFTFMLCHARPALTQDAGSQLRDQADASVQRTLLAQAAENAQKYRQGDVVVRVESADGAPLSGVVIEAQQVRQDFLFGCIGFGLVNGPPEDEADLFHQRFLDLFNLVVLPFYWSSYEPQPGKTLEEPVMRAARWCRDHHIVTKGHPLVWSNEAGTPRWLRGKSAAERDELVQQRVRREVSTFKGVIDIWDVVNEPVNTRAWDDLRSQDYVHSPIDRIADYIETSLRTAHQANPEATLLLNEFNLIPIPETRERFFALAKEMQRRGAPLSGLGIQAHEPREEWYSPQEVWNTFDRLAELGLPLHVTEFIPQSSGKPITGPWRTGTWTEEAQADFAEQMYRLAFGHPAVASVNWWGLSDKRIWLPGGGLVDKDYHPKLVYRRLQKLIRDEWMTKKRVTTDAEGKAQLRGFFGEYRLTLKSPDGATRVLQRHLHKGPDDLWTVVWDDTPQQAATTSKMDAMPITSRSFRVGTAGFVPAGFPKLTPQSIQQFWQDVQASSELHGIHTSWKDLKVLHLTARSIPTELVVGLGFQSPSEWQNDVDALKQVIKNDVLGKYPQIKYLFIGNEVNDLYDKYPDRFDDFVKAYKEIYQFVKQQFPDVKVFTTFQYESLLGQAHLRGISQRKPEWFLLDEFAGHYDLLGITTYPYFQYTSPELIPDSYYEQLTRHTDKPLAITEVGWMSREKFGGKLKALSDQRYTGSEQEQAQFIQRLAQLSATVDLEFANWLYINDFAPWTDGDVPKNVGMSVFLSDALRYHDGREKLAWKAWLKLKNVPRRRAP